jgi:hypothetical protein
MRTTIDLAPELLAAAKQLAAAREQSLGTVISELALQALRTRAEKPTTNRSGFPIFKIRKGAAPISLNDVKRDEDDE